MIPPPSPGTAGLLPKGNTPRWASHIPHQGLLTSWKTPVFFQTVLVLWLMAKPLHLHRGTRSRDRADA